MACNSHPNLTPDLWPAILQKKDRHNTVTKKKCKGPPNWPLDFYTLGHYFPAF